MVERKRWGRSRYDRCRIGHTYRSRPGFDRVWSASRGKFRMESKIGSAGGKGTERKDHQPLRCHKSERMSARKMRGSRQFPKEARRGGFRRLGQAMEVVRNGTVDEPVSFGMHILNLFHRSFPIVFSRSRFSMEAFNSARAREARVQMAFGFFPSIAAISSKLYPL